MADSWYKIIQDIKQDVGRIANKIARGTAQIALQDLQDAHSDIMDDFYAGYTPVDNYKFWYQKDNNIFYGMAHGYKRSYNLRYKSANPMGIIQIGAHGFAATMQVSSSNMSDYTNSTGHTFPASNVFDYMWNYGNRGLPPGYRGHVGEFSVSASPAGVSISGNPHSAMSDFVNQWGMVRGGEVADMIAHSI